MSGYLGQIGWATESAWNTPVTPSKFSPFTSEGIANDGGERMASMAIRAGRRMVHTHRRGVPIIGGPVAMELGNTDIATLLTHLFGNVETTGTGPYTHEYTPGRLDQSLTVQVGRPDLSGTVRPRTFSGVKFPSWTLGCSSGELATLEAEVSAAAETGETALAAASYTGWAPFAYVDGSVTKGGTPIVVDSWSIAGSNNLRTDRKALGRTTISEQLEQGMRELTINLEMDFEDLTMYEHFLDDDALTLALKLDNGTDSLTVTAKGFLTGESPVIADEGILKFSGSFVAESAVSDADAVTAVLVNGESSAA